MTVTAIVTAVGVGAGVGLLGGMFPLERREAPRWLTVAIGVVAALMGTITATLAGIDTGVLGPLPLIVPTGTAGLCVGLVILTARPRESGRTRAVEGDGA